MRSSSAEGVYSPTRLGSPDNAYVGTQVDEDRLVGFRDSQLLMALSRNGWPITLAGSDLGVGEDKGYVMVYTHLVRMEIDTIVLEGSRVPMLVIRTDGKRWRVIKTWNTGHAAETVLREQHNELDGDPLRETTTFRNARHIMFVAATSHRSCVWCSRLDHAR